MKPFKLRRRGNTLHLVRRVPKRYEHVENRKVIWISLNTDSEKLAHEKALRAWRNLEEAWEAQLAGDIPDAEARFAAAHNLAKVHGYRWLTAEEVSNLPLDHLLERINAVVDRKGNPDPKLASAILGGATQPPVNITRALELFWTLAKDRTIGMSTDQLRRWKNPRIKAIDNFVKVAGDKELSAINADDFLKFREWWSDRLSAESLSANSANKDLIHLKAVLNTVNKMKRLGLVLPFDSLASFREGSKQDRIRPPFSECWIRDRLLAAGALDGLNPEARAVFHVMVNTGCRPSEVVGLLPHHIHLNHEIPHINIRPEGKRLKTDSSKRDIPLVGVSLQALQQFPGGFPRYRFKDRISATINSFLRENGLLETPEHNLYSLRHSFEDRMLAAGFDERIRRDLFGHSLRRERYGRGASLSHSYSLLKAIAL